MQNDWRITNQINYLYRAKLKKVQFTKTLPSRSVSFWASMGVSIGFDFYLD